MASFITRDNIFPLHATIRKAPSSVPDFPNGAEPAVGDWAPSRSHPISTGFWNPWPLWPVRTYTSVSAPIQHAAVYAFRGGIRVERYLWHARRILSALGNQCAEMLSRAGVRVLPPIGGFYLFADFAPFADRLAGLGVTNGQALCERLLADTGVAILPGSAFGRPHEELTARLAYVDFDGSSALAASEMITLDQSLPENFTELWCHNVIKAVRLISDWLTD